MELACKDLYIFLLWQALPCSFHQYKISLCYWPDSLPRFIGGNPDAKVFMMPSESFKKILINLPKQSLR